ncbi:MAG: DUF488 domain-containing protein [Proteobacteria bacterium]|nr:DUF488 domain-containing protein [Pseudomonadota bacterium]
MTEQTYVTTIGFTKTTAENFFQRLLTNEVRQVIDVRLNNTSQLSGFAKAKDLIYFLQTLGEIGYVHEPLLAPTKDILTAYRKKQSDWSDYRIRFLDLMDTRSIDQNLSPDFFDHGCLLCSEDKPHHCHRSLVVEFLNDRWDDQLKVRHL